MRADANDSGIEKLRRLVGIFDSCSEDFLDRFTREQLLKIYDAHMQCAWDLYPDQWSDRQVKEALRGVVPDFREAKPNERDLVDGLVPVYRTTTKRKPVVSSRRTA